MGRVLLLQVSADPLLLFSRDQPIPSTHQGVPIASLPSLKSSRSHFIFQQQPLPALVFPVNPPAKIRPLITCPLLSPFLFPGPKLFPGSLEELHPPQATAGRAQSTSQQPPSLPPKIYRSVSVTNLRPTLLKPSQDGQSGRSLSREDLLTEANAKVVSHSSPSEQLRATDIYC